MTNGNPTVSAVIPAYNRAGIVPRAIRSVLAQTYQDWELIVVDNGSDDGTDLAVKAFTDPRISLVRHTESRGPAAARNAGIRAARGKFVAFLDSDDEWLPEKLAGDVKAFETSPGAGMVYSGKKLVDEDGHVLLVRMPTLRGRVYWELLAWDFIGSCSRVTARKDVLEAVGGYDESIVNCEDWDLWVRIARVAEVAAVDQCVVIRHLGCGHVSGSLRSICEGKMKIIEKHGREMPPEVLGRNLGALAVMLMNYDPGRARRMALEALRLRPMQPAVASALCASWLGTRAYRYVFSRWTRARHPYYIGRAAI
jgi:glycosyltransferase involved in cell wall biosynthesis